METTDSNIILDVQNLSCGYGGKPVVENFNLQVEKGDCIAITGPNGCGKSTLLKAVYQLCIINTGTITYKNQLLNGKTPEQVKRMGIAYFMQKNAIFSKLSVKENLLLSLNGTAAGIKRKKIDEAIAMFPDLENWQQKTAGLLSGGQRQQLSLAMLISQNADLLLLDEFTAGLDADKSEEFLQLFLNHFGRTSDIPKTVIFVEHKAIVIKQLAERIIKLK